MKFPDLLVDKGDGWINIKDVVALSGLRFYGLTVQPPQLTGTYQTNPGRDGELDLGQSVFGPRTITATFYFKGQDLTDFELGCRDIWAYFYERDAYYIRSTLNPGIRYLVRAKPYDPSRLAVINLRFDLEFDLLSGFGESTGTTLDMFTYDAELWQIGMHLPNGEDLQYVFNANNFRVYNASDIVIDPLQHHEFQIALTGSGTPTITNTTTGDVFKLTQAMTADDTLLIDGIYPYLNNNRCGRLTNHGILTLAKGWLSLIHI